MWIEATLWNNWILSQPPETSQCESDRFRSFEKAPEPSIRSILHKRGRKFKQSRPLPQPQAQPRSPNLIHPSSPLKTRGFVIVFKIRALFMSRSAKNDTDFGRIGFCEDFNSIGESRRELKEGRKKATRFSRMISGYWFFFPPLLVFLFVQRVRSSKLCLKSGFKIHVTGICLNLEHPFYKLLLLVYYC